MASGQHCESLLAGLFEFGSVLSSGLFEFGSVLEPFSALRVCWRVCLRAVFGVEGLFESHFQRWGLLEGLFESRFQR
jgi:hypothetical protein